VRLSYSYCNYSSAVLQSHFLPRSLSESLDRDRLRLLGTRLLRSLSLEREESEADCESEPEPEPELSESESDEESDEESEDDEEGETERLAFFDAFSSFPFPFSSLALSFSFASKIRLAVPVLFLNSSKTSTDGLPAAFSLASVLGFSNCWVREGRDTYGRGFLH